MLFCQLFESADWLQYFCLRTDSFWECICGTFDTTFDLIHNKLDHGNLTIIDTFWNQQSFGNYFLAIQSYILCLSILVQNSFKLTLNNVIVDQHIYACSQYFRYVVSESYPPNYAICYFNFMFSVWYSFSLSLSLSLRVFNISTFVSSSLIVFWSCVTRSSTYILLKFLRIYLASKIDKL